MKFKIVCFLMFMLFSTTWSLTCYTCVTEDCATGNNIMKNRFNCTGTSDKCLRSTFEKDGKTQVIAMCSPICDKAAYEAEAKKNSVSVTIKDLSCCDKDLCNSAISTKSFYSVFLLLLASVLIF